MWECPEALDEEIGKKKIGNENIKNMCTERINKKSDIKYERLEDRGQWRC